MNFTQDHPFTVKDTEDCPEGLARRAGAKPTVDAGIKAGQYPQMCAMGDREGWWLCSIGEVQELLFWVPSFLPCYQTVSKKRENRFSCSCGQ